MAILIIYEQESIRGDALDFNDTAALLFGQSNVVFFCFIFIKEYQKVPIVNYQQKCLINRIRGTFDIKSNKFGLIIPKKLKL